MTRGARVTGALAALLLLPWVSESRGLESELLLGPAAAPVTERSASDGRQVAERSLPHPSKASFTLRVGRFDVPLRVMAIPVMPSTLVDIRVLEGVAGEVTGRIVSSSGPRSRLRSVGEGAWRWTSPEPPGVHVIEFVSTEPADTMRLNLLVARPASEVIDGRLNGYRIGTYRPRPASMSAAYEPPGGFIEAPSAIYDLQVSPNFRLRDFLCKDPGDPRYLLISPRLLVKLEALLVAVNEAGYVTPTLTVMSGFRTPAYNRAIGNTTDFSRHLWGDAADVYVDTDGDGDMDDLNGDGRVDIGDARWLAQVAEDLMRRSAGSLAPGGLSVYRRNPVHGPFVHIDTRGYRARW